MQNTTLTFFLIFVCLLSNSTKAQVDRRVAPNTTTTQKSEPIDPLESAMTYLKKELTLDSFQEAAIKIYVKENFEASDKIRYSDLPESEKKLHLEKIVKSFDEKVIKILNPDQIKKYELLQNKRKNKKESKKEKKKEEEEKEEDK